MKIMQPCELNNWKERLVDVREPDEFARERLDVDHCENVPLSRLAQTSASWDRSLPILVICKSGVRSRQAAGQLENLGFQHVATLEGGLQACRSAGLPVITTKAPLPIMRQVMIGASIVLLAGLSFSLLYPAFIALTWFSASMLMFAGITGVCPMARILAHMPWNQTKQTASCTSQTSTAYTKG